MSSLQANWNYPTSVLVGAGRWKELVQCCEQLGIRTPLLVTDPGLAALPLTAELLSHCNANGLTATLFSDVKGNPTSANVDAGVAAFRAGHHDGVIALGGGSALDAGKAVALMVGQDQPIWAFEDVGDNWTRVNTAGMVPVVAIPTTAGTGSEVGRSSVITDAENKVKKIIFHPNMLPGKVILDPILSVGLPAKLTAATGMDALSHNLEALCSNFYHPMAEGIALEGIRLVQEYLPRAVADGQDLEARTHMLVASAMGATAFQKGLGAMHALAHSLGALYDAHHGMLNAILMPYVLQANRSAIEDRIVRLARYLNLEEASFAGFLQWILALRAQVGIPHGLSALGIDTTQATVVAAMSARDPAAGGNPIAFSTAQYEALFREAI
ncbi:iron-containing alcohol dehydrogenase [Ketobacter sp.]|uniref:iron-containing alcohol dehydrogenase n=1 Tax=Ketobacter sp. TaxID=2083498 RepID=UPI000F1FDAC0|nr:iron-containing alcohol dehydrogenase [Ketobacter sp.]RLU00748.1 MAG: iron-containing alcohol dehydrogenase [Ketobacter sp.]